VPDGVHAAIDDDQPPELDAVIDLGGGESEVQQLLAGHVALLAGRQHSDLPVDREVDHDIQGQLPYRYHPPASPSCKS
jgi:hypothetical protein